MKRVIALLLTLSLTLPLLTACGGRDQLTPPEEPPVVIQPTSPSVAPEAENTELTELAEPEEPVELAYVDLGGDGPVQFDPVGYPPLLITNYEGDTRRLDNDVNQDEIFSVSYSPGKRLQAVSTYHWNYGRGVEPGQIWIKESFGGPTFGPYQATGRSLNGVENAIWDVFLDDFIMEDGAGYYIVDSDPDTCSISENSNGPIVEFRGRDYHAPVESVLTGTETIEKGVAAPARGEVAYENLTVDFGTGFDGDVILAENTTGVEHDDPDFKVYDLLVTGASEELVNIFFDVPAPEEGAAYSVQLGVPVGNEAGEFGTLWLELETTWQDGKVTAAFNPAFVGDAVDDLSMLAGKTFVEKTAEAAKEVTLVGPNLVAAALNLIGDVVDKDIKAMRLALQKAQVKLTDHFILWWSPSTVPNLSEEGADRLLADMETVLSEYMKEYDITRTSWPMSVYIGNMAPLLEGGNAFFATPPWTFGGRFSTRQMAINNSYLKIDKELFVFDYKFQMDNEMQRARMDTKLKEYDDGSRFILSTVAHELFHFVQRCYTSSGQTSLWVDESCATYMAWTLTAKLLETSPEFDQHYGIDNRLQFDMLRKTLKIPKQDQFDKDYASPILFDFIAQYDAHGIRKLYETLRDGWRFSSWESVLEKVLGKSMKEICLMYYLYLGRGEMYAKNYEGWYLWRRAMDDSDHYYDQIMEKIDTKGLLQDGPTTHEFTIGPWGVHFLAFTEDMAFGPYDTIYFYNLPENMAVFSWGTFQSYQYLGNLSSSTPTSIYFDMTRSGGKKQGLGSQPMKLVAIVNCSDKNYGGGLFGSKASVDIEARTWREERMKYEESVNSNPIIVFPKNASELDTASPTGNLAYYNYNGSMETVSGGRLEILDLSGTSLDVVLYDEKGDGLYGGTLTYDPERGYAWDDMLTLQFGEVPKSSDDPFFIRANLYEKNRVIQFTHNSYLQGS